MGKRIGTIARHEYLNTIRRREFWLITFGLPLLYLVMGGLILISTRSAARTSDQEGKSALVAERFVGFLDSSGLMDRATLERGQDGVKGRLYPSLEAGQKAVRARQVRAFVVVASDFPETGGVTIYEPKKTGGGVFNETSRGGASYNTLLRRAVLTGKVDAKTRDAATAPIDPTHLSFDPASGRFAPPDPFKIIGKFVIPYVFSLLLMFSVFFSSSYLLHGIVEEKENRIIEILLSSVTHEELLAGKLIGLGGAGLTQISLWGLTGALITLPLTLLAPQFGSSLHIAPSVLVTALLMFLGGFTLYAALMAGVGSMGTTWKESQQTAGLMTLPVTVPLMFMPAILEQPNGGIARFLSLFPFTAPIGMMLRTAAGGGSALEIAIAALLLALATVGVIIIAARLLRLSLLLYGQRPSAALIWQGLRTRAS